MYIKLLSISFLLLATATAGATEDKAKKLDDFIESYAENREFNGSALISYKGNVLLEKGYGYANMEWKIPNSVDTKFRIASTTKPFTAALVLKLVEEGKIKLSHPISDYLPDYRSDTGGKVSIHQLLNHTSGIPNVFSHPEFRNIEANNPYGLDDFISKFCSGDLQFEPGTQFRYSNAGYTILGKIVEQVSELSYQQALQKYIFDPLKMHNSGDSYAGAVVPKLAEGYERTLAGFKPAKNIDMTVTHAAGSIYSTVRDLYQFSKALHSGGLLSEELKQKAFSVSPHRNYGYGWLITDLPEDKFDKKLTQIHHPGMMSGFNGDVVRIIEDDITIIIQNNTGGAPLRAMTEGILNIIYNKPVTFAQIGIEDRLYSTLRQNGLRTAINTYMQLQKLDRGFSERGLNSFGYQLMEVGSIEAAIAFFQINSEEHPNSSNAYDSLGEAYLANKEFKKALVAYEKALLLDEDNRNAAEAIVKIKKSL
ncbi:serine hydrolase [Idiomarina loihiensis]|uniref:serine hydrolase domain-containing protein n=1 Tax=Idiomarina loihiensis TaxID=135577 RepID=UPI00129CA613|nr:serine hydrolase domain-containing protein [Idiomarina loihiensis]MRJ44143.1 serine hydrolase [Idiomarina loihiensis]UTW33736.1 serine hydrolase [Idiomarina loihiensis]